MSRPERPESINGPQANARPMSELVVRCPTCGKRGAWFDTPFGPFCSKRCRLIDLGKWLQEEHALSEPLPEEHMPPPPPPRSEE
jgi:endogenous inhibitor of DNA gyrase (YacG/DUF329 family)